MKESFSMVQNILFVCYIKVLPAHQWENILEKLWETMQFFFDSGLWRELLASLQSASTFVRRISARIASYTDQRQLSEIHSFLQRCHVPNTSPSITEPCMHALAIVMTWIFYGCFFWSHGYSQGKPRPG